MTTSSGRTRHASGRTGQPHLRRRRGSSRIAWSILMDDSRCAGLKPSMVPRSPGLKGRGFMDLIINC